jgi:hypothetical protein
MKDEHNKESAFKTAGRGTGLVILIASAIVVIAALMYYGLSSPTPPGL